MLRGNKRREKEVRRWTEGGMGNISEGEDGDNERDQLGLGAGSMIKDRKQNNAGNECQNHTSKLRVIQSITVAFQVWRSTYQVTTCAEAPMDGHVIQG
jgi:hypothetical protein